MRFVAHFIIFGPLLLSVLNLLPIEYPIQEANLSLGVYYLVHHLLALPLFLWVRANYSRREFILGLALLIVVSASYLRVVLPYYSPFISSRVESPVGKLSVFFANAYLANVNFQGLTDQIESSAPDIVGLVEVDKIWLDRLALPKIYPYKIELPSDDNYGIALYSKLPLTEVEQSVGEDLPPVIMASVELAGTKLRLACLHAENPLFGTTQSLVNRNLTLRRVVSRLRDVEYAAIVLGDFNATPFSKFYKLYVNESDFRDAMWGYGLWRSWDAFSVPLRLKLDHLLYRGDLAVKSFRMMPFFGSDHLPMLAEFELGRGFDSSDDVLNNAPHD